MKIKLNQDGTYTFTVTTDEDRQLFDALSESVLAGQKVKYGGRSGNSNDDDYHLYLRIDGQPFVLREDKGGDILGFVRDAMFFGGSPTLISLANGDVKSITVGIITCGACGSWKHGFAGHCKSCIETCDHTYERRWTLSPALGQVMALICSKCGQIDADDFERLKGMSQIDRLVEVADETGTNQFIYPADKKGNKFELGVEVHSAQEILRATKK